MKNQKEVRFCLILLTAVTLMPGPGKTAEHIVQVVSDYENLRMVFEPRNLKIEPGDTVTWINEANEEHNVISYPDGYPRGAKLIQSAILTKEGERFSYRFDTPGTYEYHCIPHLPMGMHGSIIVGQPSENDDFHQPTPEQVKAYRDLIQEWFDEDDIELLEREDRASASDADFAHSIDPATRPLTSD